MTREEQIEQANPMRLSPSEYEEWNKGDTIYNHRASYSEGFEEGAKWADSHPNWHKFPDEKPTEGKWYFIYEIDEDINLDFWERDYEIWSNSYDDRVVAWMELPQPPKFG